MRKEKIPYEGTLIGLGFRLRKRFKGTVAILENDCVRVAQLRCTPLSVSILRYAEEPLPEEDSNLPEAFARGLSKALASCGLHREDVVIGLPYSFCHLDVLNVPPVDEKNLAAIIERKILKSSGSEGRDDAWSFEVIEKQSTGKEGGAKVLLARMPAGVLLELHDALRRHGIKTSMITVPLTGVLNLVRLMSDDACRGSIMAVNASAGGAMLSIFVDKKLKQTRFLKERAPADRESFNSFLQTEMRRSMAFHKEKYKGRGIDKILVLGTQTAGVNLKTDSFEIQLPLPENPPESWAARFGDEVPNPKAADCGLLALVTGYLLAGNAWTSPLFRRPKSVINFALPRKRTGLVVAAAGIITILALAGIASFSDGLNRKNGGRVLIADLLEHEIRPYERVEARHEELLELKQYYLGLNQEFESLKRARRNVAQSMLTVRECLPTWTELSSITYLRDEDSMDRLRFQFKGDFTAGKSRALQGILAVLRSTELFRDVSFFTSGAQSNPAGKEGMTEIIDLELLLK